MRTASKLGIMLSAVSPAFAMGANGIIAIGDVYPADPAVWTPNTLLGVGSNSFGYVSVAYGVLSTRTIDVGGGIVSLQGTSADISAATSIGTRASRRGTLDLEFCTVGLSPGPATFTTMFLSVGCGGEGQVSAIDSTIQSSMTLIGDSATGWGAVDVSGNNGLFNSGSLTVGSKGQGILTVASGAKASSTSAVIGKSGQGKVVISGPGSTWTTGGLNIADAGTGGIEFLSGVEIADAGTGSMEILSGGSVSSQFATIGNTGYADVSVTGSGSRWTNNGSLDLKNGSLLISDGATLTSSRTTVSNGTLTIREGGRFQINRLSVNTGGSVQFNVSGDDMMVTDGRFPSITNESTIRVLADAFLPAAVYRPISNGAGGTVTWSGGGVVKAAGGTWDQASQLFSVAPAAELDVGEIAAIATGQRLIYEDAKSNRRLGVSFGAVTGTQQFSVTAMGDESLADLAGAGIILSAWDINTTLSAAEVLVSFELDAGLDVSQLQSWHYDGANWAQINSTDFFYDSDGIAIFTVNSFSGYAMVLVPEPMLIMLPACLTVGLLGRRRQRSS